MAQPKHCLFLAIAPFNISWLKHFPIFFPVVSNLGFDPVWFGVIVVMVVELGLITPPIGMNVFIIKGMVPDVPLGAIYLGVLPVVLAQILLIALLIAVPALALWLPQSMG